MRHHRHPTRDERDAMRATHVEGRGANGTAGAIGRDRATAGREPRRSGRSSHHGPATARERHEGRRRACRPRRGPAGPAPYGAARPHMADDRWPPGQMDGRMGLGDGGARVVSLGTIHREVNAGRLDGPGAPGGRGFGQGLRRGAGPGGAAGGTGPGARSGPATSSTRGPPGPTCGSAWATGGTTPWRAPRARAPSRSWTAGRAPCAAARRRLAGAPAWPGSRSSRSGRGRCSRSRPTGAGSSRATDGSADGRAAPRSTSAPPTTRGRGARARAPTAWSGSSARGAPTSRGCPRRTSGARSR